MSSSASILSGLVVADFGLGMSAALISKFISEAGATINRLEPSSGDPFYAVYPAYTLWHQQQNTQSGNKAESDSLVQNADICLIGGEDYPELNWQFDAQALLAANPKLIVLKIDSCLPIEGEADMPAHELLAQARSGFSFENYSDRPLAYNYPVATYGATFNAIMGIFTALIHREMTGEGQIVSTSLLEGALDSSRSNWFQAENPDPLFMAMVPKDCRMTIFKCKDGKYVHMMMGTPGAKDRFYALLNLNPDDFIDTLNDRGMPTGQGDPSMFWGDIDAFSKPISQYTSDEFIKLLQEHDFPAVRVMQPGECWEMPQVTHNEILKTDTSGRQYVGFPINGL